MSHSRAAGFRLRTVVAVLGLGVALSACSGTDDGPLLTGSPTPTPSPTKAAVAKDLSTLVVTRADFCDQIDTLVLAEGLPLAEATAPSPGATTAPAATGGASGTAAPTASASADPSLAPALVAWTNGDRVNGTKAGDRAQEFGCRWNLPGAPQTVAAWVYAPPVTKGRARELAQALGEGCRPGRTAIPFGSVSGAVTCDPSTDRPKAVVRWGGLFGEGWLVCEAAGPRAVARAATFCPALATRIATD